MALNPNVLSAELQKIENASTEPPVVEGWAQAYATYMMGSGVLGIAPAGESAFAPAKAAMAGVLVGISAPQPIALPAAQKIALAVKTFWLTALPLCSAIWVTAPPLLPAFTPPLTFLDPSAEQLAIQALAAVFTANIAVPSKDVAYDAIAAVVHLMGLGATVTQATVPAPTPGIPVL